MEATRASTTSRPPAPWCGQVCSSSGAKASLASKPRRELPHPGHLLVAPVPDQGDGAAWAQDTGDLGSGGFGVEPVERLRRDHGVDARIGERHRLGDGIEDLGVRDVLRQHIAHAGDRLEGEQARTAAGELARELARARAELQQRAARRRARQREDRLDRPGGVAGAAGLVGLGRPVEADRGGTVDVAPHAIRSGSGSPGASSIARKPSGTAMASSSGRRRSGRRAWIS
jgi:hypothetical protein